MKEMIHENALAFLKQNQSGHCDREFVHDFLAILGVDTSKITSQEAHLYKLVDFSLCPFVPFVVNPSLTTKDTKNTKNSQSLL